MRRPAPLPLSGGQPRRSGGVGLQPGLPERRVTEVGLLGQALGEEKRGADGGRPGSADALQLLEFIEGRPRDGRQATEVIGERLSKFPERRRWVAD